jgi:hypothetical protein
VTPSSAWDFWLGFRRFLVTMLARFVLSLVVCVAGIILWAVESGNLDNPGSCNGTVEPVVFARF